MRRLKGPTRPINPQSDRAGVLLALRAVDFVSIFSEDTPLELIRLLNPDVLVKGAEYTRGSIVGADVVEAQGGIVRRVRMVRGYSTTEMLKRAGSKR